MNISHNATRVLCYGDSNTHGRDPKKKFEEGIKVRFPVGVSGLHIDEKDQAVVAQVVYQKIVEEF